MDLNLYRRWFALPRTCASGKSNLHSGPIP